jgi:hypothetical protein
MRFSSGYALLEGFRHVFNQLAHDPASFRTEVNHLLARFEQGRTHHAKDFAQELLLTLQTPFDLGHQVVGEAQVIESLFHDLGGVLRLAAIMCEALLCLAAATLSGFHMLFGVSCGGGHGALLDAVWVLGDCRLPKHL